MKYRVINKDRINDLVDMRLKYLREDFQSTSEESFNLVRDNLPKYFENHLNTDLFAFGAFCDDKIVSTAFLLRACVHREDVQIFEHNFAEDKAKK